MTKNYAYGKFAKAIRRIAEEACYHPEFLSELTAAGFNRVKINAALRKKSIGLPKVPGAPHAKVRFLKNTTDLGHVVIRVRIPVGRRA
jgi:hypothetical protein